MTELGYIAQTLAFVVAIYAVAASVVGARHKLPNLVASAENAALACTALLLFAVGTLLYAFLTNDFQVEFVAENSSRFLPTYLRLTALWGGQAGSLLFWATLLSILIAAVVLQNRHKHRELMPWVVAVLMLTEAFFIFLVSFIINPFQLLDFVPADGNGLNPLLRHPAMTMHPPTLYLGFTGFTIPFAFAVAALITRQLGSEWIRLTRRWTLVAWLFLSIGIGLGGRWAYDVLGWGGYWGWDPVENASFLPWLTGTAFLHSVMVQERKGMLKVWNMVLIWMTYGLVLFGTFITRSGIISSVHAFAQSAIGPYFLAFIGLSLSGSLILILDRLGDLKSKTQMDSLISREAIFLLQNLLFVGAMFAILWGTIFPMLSEIIVGNKITVGPPYFNKVAGPILGGIVLVMGVIPLISWGGASLQKLRLNLMWPVGITVTGLAGLFVAGIREPLGLLGFGLCIFGGVTTLTEFVQGMRVRHRSTGENYLAALWGLIVRNRRRYGGYLVHAAIILMTLGIVGSNVYKVEKTVALARGESMQIGSYTLTFERLDQYPAVDKQITAAQVTVTQNGQRLGTLVPTREFYSKSQQPMTIPAVRTTLGEDLYLIVAGWEDNGSTATIQATINPLIVWLWIGGALFIISTLVAAWPERERRQVLVPRPVPARGPRPSEL